MKLVIQVLVNLIDNAIKYTLPGSTIWICGCREDGKAKISVTDDGPGIDDEMCIRDSSPWSNTITWLLYGVYFLVTVVLLIAPKIKK